MVISRIIFTLADNLALPLMLAEGYESCIKLRRTPFLFPLLKQGSISPFYPIDSLLKFKGQFEEGPMSVRSK